MDKVTKWLKTRSAQAVLAACFALAVLTAVFFLQPGPEKGEPAGTAPAPLQDASLPSQQAQSALPSIDVDAVLRQAQAATTEAFSLMGTAAAPTSAAVQAAATLPPQTAPPIQAAAVAQTARASTSARTTTRYAYGTAAATGVPATKTTTSAPPSTIPPTTTTTTAPAQLTCTITVRCNTILSNKDKLGAAKAAVVPPDGVILQSKSVVFTQGETVFDALKRAAQSEKMHLDFENNPLYNSAYIAAIGNIYERDCGDLSGWMYRVNGVFPGYGCGKYTLKAGDAVEWLYTCDLGKDIGAEGISQR